MHNPYLLPLLLSCAASEPFGPLAVELHSNDVDGATRQLLCKGSEPRADLDYEFAGCEICNGKERLSYCGVTKEVLPEPTSTLGSGRTPGHGRGR